MRFRTLEIRWHDSKPISTCDFQPLPFKKARHPQGSERNYTTQSYRLATGGEDNHVRIWMVHPNLRPPNVLSEADLAAQGITPRPPKVEYLATLSRHSAAVNVVRFSPNGELIASAGDDGMIIIWAPSATPQSATYGSDLTPEELQHEKEFWKPRITFRCTQMQVYDLAWSPTGEYIVAGSTDNTVRVYAAADGKCVCEVAEHSHYVQGVAWDPLNEYIATQSSDRSMHIYRITSKPIHTPTGPQGTFELHAIGKNTKMPHRHSRTPSAHGQSRPRMLRRESTASETESAIVLDWDDTLSTTSSYKERDIPTPLTPAASVGGGGSGTAATPSASFMFPPPPIDSSSRRSSFSGSNAPGSPSTAFSTPSLPPSTNNASSSNNTRYGRSPSPMPPLPAIRSMPSPSSSSQHASIARAAHWASLRLYGDESYTNFFRRLSFSPDGGLLLTPAGQFEDPSVNVGAGDGTPLRGRRGHPSEIDASSSLFSTSGSGGSTSSVYIYSRANFARPPIAQLPGHKKASVAVKFSPVLYELRAGVQAPGGAAGSQVPVPTVVLEKGEDVQKDGQMDVDIVGPTSTSTSSTSDQQAVVFQRQRSTTPALLATPQKTPIGLAPPPPSASGSGSGTVVSPSFNKPDAISTSGLGLIATGGNGSMSTNTMPSPALSPMDLRPPTPVASKPSTPAPSSHSHSISSGAHQLPSTTPSSSSSLSTPNVTQPASMFALPYRMLFAVMTMDTVTIYDTQQASPLCLLTKLHYDEFTDLTWSPDGQCLMLSSRDGYCTIVVFDEIIPAYHTQQQALQFQSIAQHHSVPVSIPTHSHTHSLSHSHSQGSHHYHQHSTHATPAATPSMGTTGLPSASGGLLLATTTPSSASKKRPAPSTSTSGSGGEKAIEPPLTPAASVDGSESGHASVSGGLGLGFGLSSVPAGSGHTHAHTHRHAANQSQSHGMDVDGTSAGAGANAPAAEGQGPPKKKRRVALTRVGDLDV